MARRPESLPGLVTSYNHTALGLRVSMNSKYMHRECLSSDLCLVYLSLHTFTQAWYIAYKGIPFNLFTLVYLHHTYLLNMICVCIQRLQKWYVPTGNLKPETETGVPVPVNYYAFKHAGTTAEIFFVARL